MAQFRRAERYNIKHLKIVFFTPKAYTIPSKAQKYIFFQIYTYKINFEWKSLQIINIRSLFDHWRKNRPHVGYLGEKKKQIGAGPHLGYWSLASKVTGDRASPPCFFMSRDPLA